MRKLKGYAIEIEGKGWVKVLGTHNPLSGEEQLALYRYLKSEALKLKSLEVNRTLDEQDCIEFAEAKTKWMLQLGKQESEKPTSLSTAA